MAFGLLAIIGATILYCFPAYVQATEIDNALNGESGLIETAKQAHIPVDGLTIYQILGKIIAYGLAVLTVVFFIITIYGGITWMSAFGNEEKAERASRILSHGGIGLGVTLIAFLLTNFVVLKIINIVIGATN